MNNLTYPELWVDSHHGIYMYQIAYEKLDDIYKEQIGFSQEEMVDIMYTDNESHFDCVDKMLNTTFETIEGNKFMLICNEDLWLVPMSFIESEESEDWFI